MRRYLFFLLIISTFACASNSPDSNLNNKTPSPSPTVLAEQQETEKQQALVKQEEEDKQLKAEIDKAISDFSTKNYKGWQLKGLSDEYNCQELSTDPCHLLLIKGQKEQIISVMIRRFTSSDGKTFLVAFEARPIDLAKAMIEQIKEREKDSVFENLTYSDCSDICKD